MDKRGIVTQAVLDAIGFKSDDKWIEMHGGTGPWGWAAAKRGNVRVIVSVDGVGIFAFGDTETRKGEAAIGWGPVEWEITFSPGTPKAVVIAALQGIVAGAGVL